MPGILTGLLVVSRNISRRWVSELVVVELLGAVILLTEVPQKKKPPKKAGHYPRRQSIKDSSRALDS